MRTIMLALAALATFGGTAALAQDAAPKSGTLLVTSDGKRVGRIDRVITGANGEPKSVSVIYDSRFVYVPVSSLTMGDGRVTTSLTRKEVAALR